MKLTVLCIILIASLSLLYLRSKLKQKKKQQILDEVFPSAWEAILMEKVAFFRQLSSENKELFRKRIKVFVSETPISGVETEIDDEVKVLVACSAVIPVFYFKDWEYANLSEVIVYGKVIDSYQLENSAQTNSIVGQVRPFQNHHVMLLSKPLLLQGFLAMNHKHNVGFHEFAHLIDEADGDIDGIPKALLPANLIKPWTELMYKEIEKIKSGKSDIDAYGITNHAEFFAVVCEYFFEDTDRFHNKHPELYQLLSSAFKRR
jgi:Mlc titration factor MtfA (ptsG expression regulator)